MLQTCRNAILSGEAFESLEMCLQDIAKDAYVPDSQIREAVLEGCEQAIDHLLEQGIINLEAEECLTRYTETFKLSVEELDRRGAWTRATQSTVLREVLNGIIPQRMRIEGSVPFNFQQSEKVVWIFRNVGYYENRTHRSYQGGSQGVSLRIASGVYYRAGGFRGYPVDSSEWVKLDTGMLAVTDKHIYFTGSSKSFRINYRKIVSFSPLSDGMTIQRDGLNAKAQAFALGDGWFVYNLVTNLCRLAS
jgi:hypothetical protein